MQSQQRASPKSLAREGSEDDEAAAEMRLRSKGKLALTGVEAGRSDWSQAEKEAKTTAPCQQRPPPNERTPRQDEGRDGEYLPGVHGVRQLDWLRAELAKEGGIKVRKGQIVGSLSEKGEETEDENKASRAKDEK
ncbi:hypothetical protein G7Y79_00042g078670 [Physcia stellaris]|nr:hypothetical protein G7Y79_00042g078670 [Physcia stellaris]